MKTYQDYLRAVNHIYDLINAWYEIADDKWQQGDQKGQAKAYAEIDKLVVRKNALVNPEEAPLLADDENLFD